MLFTVCLCQKKKKILHVGAKAISFYTLGNFYDMYKCFLHGRTFITQKL